MAQIRMFTNDELPSEHIYQITQDNNGFVWFLTEEGMVKYDGTNLKIFNTANGLPTNGIWNSAITSDKIWYLCKGSEQGYIQNDSVHNFKLDSGSFHPPGYTMQGDEILLNSTQEHIYRPNNGKWQLENSFNLVNNDSFYFHNINLPSVSHGQSDYKTLSLFNEEKIVLSFPINYLFSSSFKIYGDSLIMLTLDKELHFINVKKRQHIKASIPLKEKEVLYGTSIRLINDEFQVSYKNFVGILDKNYNLKYSYHIDPKYNAHANLIDKEGNIWLGSFTTGIHFISKNELKSFSNKSIKSCYAPVWYNNDVYYVTDGDIKTFNKKQTIIETEDYVYFSNQIKDKLYYILPKSRLVQIKGATKKMIPTYLNGKQVRYALLKILELNDNEYIAKSFSQLYIFDKNFEYKKIYRIVSSNIFLNNDTVLIATNNGLFFINEKDQIQPTVIEDAISTLIPWNNGLLLGTTGKGLLFHKNGKSRYLDLDNASISKLQLYNDSLLFCATNKGLICLKRKADFFEAYYNYTQKDGLKSIKTNGFAIDDEENIYIATKKGISKTKLIFPNQVKPRLKEIFIDNIVWNTQKIKERDHLEFRNQKRKSLEINFFTKYFAVKPNLQYAYRFKGDKGDFKPLQKGHLLLNDLAIGKHQLELKISIPYIESVTKTIHLRVKPRWFESLWFILSLIGLAFVVSYIIVKKSVRKKTEERMQSLEKEAVLSNFKLLALRSQMNPHFVFNSLNAIQYYITDNQNELSEKYLLSFAKLVRQFFDLSEISNIFLDQEIGLLTNYLVLERMRFEEKLDFEIKVDDKINTKSTEIPTMLLQPIVENAVNHGVFHKESKGMVYVNFIYLAKNEYKVEIIDDGIGVANSKTLKAKSMQGHQSKSTMIINERIELLNNTKEWQINCESSNSCEDEQHPGTKVSIYLKRIYESDIDR